MTNAAAKTLYSAERMFLQDNFYPIMSIGSRSGKEATLSLNNGEIVTEELDLKSRPYRVWITMEVKWIVARRRVIDRQEACDRVKQGEARTLKAQRMDGARLEVKVMYFNNAESSESHPMYCCRVSHIPGENKKDFYVTYQKTLPELENLLRRFETEADLHYAKEWTGEWPPNNCCVYLLLVFRAPLKIT